MSSGCCNNGERTSASCIVSACTLLPPHHRKPSHLPTTCLGMVDHLQPQDVAIQSYSLQRSRPKCMRPPCCHGSMDGWVGKRMRCGVTNLANHSVIDTIVRVPVQRAGEVSHAHHFIDVRKTHPHPWSWCVVLLLDCCKQGKQGTVANVPHLPWCRRTPATS